MRAHRARQARRRLGKRLIIAACALVLVVSAAVVLGPVRLANSTPRWWQAIAADDPEVAAQARNIERALTQQLDTRRPDGELWDLALREEHANQWLASRLPAWVKNQSGTWPDTVRQVAVRFDAGLLAVSADVGSTDEPRVMTVLLRPECPEPGTLTLHLDDVWVNRLSLGRAIGEAAIRRMLGDFLEREPEARAAVERVLAGEPLPWDLTASLTDGRRVLIEGVSVEGGRLLVACRSIDGLARGASRGDVP